MSAAPQTSIDATLTQGEARRPALPVVPTGAHRQPIETLTTPLVPVIFDLADGRVVKGWMATHILGTSRIDGRAGNRTYWRVVDEAAPFGARVRLIEPPPVRWAAIGERAP